VPRYFFHLYDGIETRDPDGLVLSGIEAAIAVATHELRQLARYELQRQGQPAMSDHIDIAIESGGVVDSVCFADVL